MKVLLGIRVLLTLFVAALMPLELAHCALMPWQVRTVAIESVHHDDGDHDCCPDAAPSSNPRPAPDPCCCDRFLLPAATAPALVSVAAPTSVVVPLALAPTSASAVDAPCSFVRLKPDARSGSPPDPSTAAQSPRSPPHSA